MNKKLFLLGAALLLVICSEVFIGNNVLLSKEINNIDQLISQYNLTPYVNKIEKNLKSNWFPSKYGENVEVSFKVLKDGKYKDLRIVKPSKYRMDNQAALDAVMFTFPFDPIPTNEKEITINYTFSGVSKIR